MSEWDGDTETTGDGGPGGSAPSDDAERLRALYSASRDLMDAQTPESVATVATETARRVLGLELCGVFLAEADYLVPVAATDAAVELFGDIPHLRRGESVGWEVFERGEAAVFDDVRDADVKQNPTTAIRSELLLPLGDHGVFLAGSTTPAEFTESRVSLAKVFASNVEAALDRGEREMRLTAQNDRLDEFAAVVSHDLRNPLNVAQGRLELARKECESSQLDAVASAHDRLESLLADLLALARDGRGVGDTELVSMNTVVDEARGDVPSSLDVTVEGEWTIEADRGRLRELLSNLLGNAASHGGSVVRIGQLTNDGGFFVADDGPGVDPADHERVFDYGYTTATDGSGFGLAIVQNIAHAHGWRVRMTESENGGARVEVLTECSPRPEANRE